MTDTKTQGSPEAAVRRALAETIDAAFESATETVELPTPSAEELQAIAFTLAARVGFAAGGTATGVALPVVALSIDESKTLLAVVLQAANNLDEKPGVATVPASYGESDA